MAVFRIEKTRDYTVMANHHLRNTALSLKAKGLLSLMLSLPEDWDYTTKGLARICRDGVDSICATVRELEEAGYIDGCTRTQMFTKIILPLLKPVTSPVIILNAVAVFNDFTNPLYFLPGTKNATIQLTLFNFIGRYSSSYNLLFANVIMITLPMLVLFLFFNKRIVDGMVAGSVKG